MSYTYVIMEVSRPTFEEIRRKLLDAGYNHAIDGRRAWETIDMHGIALRVDAPSERQEQTYRTNRRALAAAAPHLRPVGSGRLRTTWSDVQRWWRRV